MMVIANDQPKVLRTTGNNSWNYGSWPVNDDHDGEYSPEVIPQDFVQPSYPEGATGRSAFQGF
jgi:hypothetical protein